MNFDDNWKFHLGNAADGLQPAQADFPADSSKSK